MHDLSHRLHPAKLRLIGLVVGAAGPSARVVAVRTGDHVHVRDVPANLPHDVTLSLFRIVQEALQNAVKHSRARTVASICGGLHGLTLTVTDDGGGFDVDEVWGKGLGLISMNERVEALGARSTFDRHA